MLETWKTYVEMTAKVPVYERNFSVEQLWARTVQANCFSAGFFEKPYETISRSMAENQKMINSMKHN